MTDDLRDRVKKAVELYTQNQNPKPKRKNEKPEKGVERACVEWMRLNKWDVNIFEAKATFNPRLGRYLSKAMNAGTADCMGNMPSGHAVVVEFKAPGRLATFAQEGNEAQRSFILRKIDSGAFAVVVDSLEGLYAIYQGWNRLIREGHAEEAKRFLMDQLPKRKRKAKEPAW